METFIWENCQKGVWMAGIVPSANILTAGSPMSAGNSYTSNNQSQFLTSSINNNIYYHQVPSGIKQTVATTKFVPSTRIKTNEFFFKWISDKNKEQLQEVANFIKLNNRIPKPNDLQSFKVIERFLLFKFLAKFIQITSIWAKWKANKQISQSNNK